MLRLSVLCKMMELKRCCTQNFGSGVVCRVNEGAKSLLSPRQIEETALCCRGRVLLRNMGGIHVSVEPGLHGSTYLDRDSSWGMGGENRSGQVSAVTDIDRNGRELAPSPE